jgi:hypothetical protein
LGKKISKWKKNISDEHRSGRPVSVATDTVKQQIEQRTRDRSRVNIDEIAVELNMTHGSAYDTVHDDVEYRKVCSRWVPRQLSGYQKHARQTICQEHLARHAREEDAFLHRIVTGGLSWVYHYKTENKRQLMQWNQLLSPANKEFKTQVSAGNVMLTIFWDVNGPKLCTSRKRVKI